MDREYASVYRELYEQHWWWRARRHLLCRVIDELQPAGNWGPILDVGCGDGLFFDWLAQRGAVEGVEADASLVTATGAWAKRIHVGPFDRSFQPGKRFGLILMLDVLEHIADPTESLLRAEELLAPGGVLLVTVPAFRALWTHHDELNHHVTRFSRAQLLGLFRRTRLQVRLARYLFHWLVLVKLAVRWKELVLGPSKGPRRLPPSWVNRTLYRLCLIEQQAGSALRLPFGSSVLVVADSR